MTKKGKRRRGLSSVIPAKADDPRGHLRGRALRVHARRARERVVPERGRDVGPLGSRFRGNDGERRSGMSQNQNRPATLSNRAPGDSFQDAPFIAVRSGWRCSRLQTLGYRLIVDLSCHWRRLLEVRVARHIEAAPSRDTLFSVAEPKWDGYQQIRPRSRRGLLFCARFYLHRSQGWPREDARSRS